MFKVFKMKPQTPADVKIEQVIKSLFPPIEVRKDKEGNKYHVDYSADTNLEAALHDLQDGYNDATAQKTIRSVVERLYEVRKMLEAYQEIDAEAKYIICDDPEGTSIEEIQATESSYR